MKIQRTSKNLSEIIKDSIKIAKENNFLILDEPTNDLDIVTLQTLEQFLLDFQGCVLIVSHDRYFLDRLVDHVFAFEGNGVVKDFPGNYSEYRQWVYDREDDDEISAPQIGGSEVESNKLLEKELLEKNKLVEAQHSNNQQPTTKKLSFKEQKELETVEADLAQLEKRKTELEALLTGGLTDAVEIQKTSVEFNTVSNSIDEKTLRWLELQD